MIFLAPTSGDSAVVVVAIVAVAGGGIPKSSHAGTATYQSFVPCWPCASWCRSSGWW